MLRKILSAAAVLALAGCSNGLRITVSNGTDIDRNNETVSVPVPGKMAGQGLAVETSGGQILPHQTITGADGSVSVLFQASVPGNSSEDYIIRKAKTASFDTLAYSRYVPERLDDYAYENNLVAGRIYGPALKDPRTFGPDLWLKCTERLVIDEWFAKGDYHHNHGDGMDCYKVAGTLGGGACAPYLDSTIFIGDNWASYEHICDGAVRTAASFRYDGFKVGDAEVSAERTLELDANTRLIKWTVTFHSEQDSLDVVLGAVLHKVLAMSHGENYLEFTEKASDSKNPDRDGNISVGLVLEPRYAADLRIMDGHATLAFRVKSGESVTYWTASGWSQGGVESPEAWKAYMEEQARIVANPLVINVK